VLLLIPILLEVRTRAGGAVCWPAFRAEPPRVADGTRPAGAGDPHPRRPARP